MAERLALWVAARWKALSVSVGLVILGCAIGWFHLGPKLVDRWVLLESPAVLDWSEQLLYRDLVMATGAFAGAAFVVMVLGLGACIRRVLLRDRLNESLRPHEPRPSGLDG